MVIAVFRSRLRPGVEDEFKALGDQMLEIAQAMPGFISYKVYSSDDAERASIIEFASREELQAWRDQPEHLAAQKLGRERFYETYSLVVSEPVRDSQFTR